jgi:large subunit ribosomal protein L9
MVFRNILLIKNIQNLGDAGDVIRVKGGYARNFLLPNNLAIIISRKNSNYINHRKNLITKKNVLKESNLKELSERLEKMELTIYSDVTTKGKLFGSITSKDISRNLKNHDLHLNYKQIVIPNPIKYIGCHKVKIELGTNLSSILTINVTN